MSNFDDTQVTFLFNFDIIQVPLISLSVFVFAFSLGFGPIPWLMMSELFAPEVKSAEYKIANEIEVNSAKYKIADQLNIKI